MIFGVCLQIHVFAKRWREVLKWGVNAQGFSQALRLNTLRTLRSWGGCFLGNLLRPTRGRHCETYLFQIKQTSLWKIHFRAMSLNFIFNTRVPIFFISNVSENQFQNFQLARLFAHFLFVCIHIFLRRFYFLPQNLLILYPRYTTGLHISLLSNC